MMITMRSPSCAGAILTTTCFLEVAPFAYATCQLSD
jgi:hypothetical protein